MVSKIFKLDDEMKVTYINQLSGEKWLRWKIYKECSPQEKEKINLSFFPNNCILLDRDLNTTEDEKILSDYNGFKKMLLKRKLSFFVSWRSPHGYHVLLPFKNLNDFSIEKQDLIRKFYIELFGCDIAKASTKGVVSLPDRPHFKNGIIYSILEEFDGENILHQEAINYADEKIITKKERRELKDLFDLDFKEYFEKDEFFNYIRDNIIPDSSERNNIIFPNLAIAAVKSGKPKEEIDEILKPIFQKNFPGKRYSEFEGWYKKAENKDITDYNPFIINKWIKNNTTIEKDIYDVSSIAVELRDEIEQFEYDLFSKTKNEVLKNIDSYLMRILQLEHPILRNYFTGKIALKISVNKKELGVRLKELEYRLKTKLKPISVFELMEQEPVQDTYIIDKVLPKGKTILVGAKGGKGKSLWVLSMCLSIATQQKYLNHFNILMKPKILYYSLENLQNREHIRIKYLMEDKPKALTNFDMSFDFEKINLKHEVEKCMEYDLIVLDSYRRVLFGAENDSEITNKFYMEFLKPLMEAGKTIILIHHLKKCKLSELEQEDLMDSFRGSGDIVNQFDSVFLLDRSQEKISVDGKRMMFDIYINLGVKNRDGNMVEDLCISVIKNDETGKTELKYLGNIRPKTHKEKAKNFILNLTKNGEVERKEIISKTSSEFPSYSIAAVIKFLEELVIEGSLYKTQYGKYTSKREEEEGKQ